MSEHPPCQTRLVQRLRALVYHINETGTADQTDKQTVREAADEIESLRARLEKAEAERELFAAQLQKADGEIIRSAATILEARTKLRTARNDALEEAERALDAACEASGGHFVTARDMIRALKDKS